MLEETLDDRIIALETKAADEYSQSCLEGSRSALRSRRCGWVKS